jgi:hypothetical protein
MTESTFHGVEENQVAGFELAAIDFFCHFGLFLGSSG